MWLPRRDTVLAAAFSAVSFTTYLVTLGYRRVFTEDAVEFGIGGPEIVLFALFYFGPLAGIGGLAVATRRRGLVLPIAGAVGGLLVLPWLGSYTPRFDVIESFSPSLSVLFVSLSVVAGIEYGVRRPGVVCHWVTPRTAAVALAAGLVHCGVLFAAILRTGLGYEHAVALLWPVVGFVLLGTVPVVLFARYTLVTPATLVAIVATYLVHTELYVTTMDSPIAFYVFVWFVPFGFALLLGGVEFCLRRWFRFFPPRSFSVE